MNLKLSLHLDREGRQIQRAGNDSAKIRQQVICWKEVDKIKDEIFHQLLANLLRVGEEPQRALWTRFKLQISLGMRFYIKMDRNPIGYILTSIIIV